MIAINNGCAIPVKCHLYNIESIFSLLDGIIIGHFIVALRHKYAVFLVNNDLSSPIPQRGAAYARQQTHNNVAVPWSILCI